MDRNVFRHELAQQLRVDSVRSSAAAGSGHPTSSFSAAELMAVLLDGHLRLDPSRPDDPARDHLVFSKGHASPLFYACLKAAAAIDDEEMLTFRKLGSRIEGHPTPVLPWVDVATGSLGQGLPVAAGLALTAKRLDRVRLPRLGPVRRQRAGRRLDLGGLRPRLVLEARQPDRDRRREPPRPDRGDDARLGPRPVRRARPQLRLGGDRGRRPRRGSGRGGLRPRRGHRGPPDRGAGPHPQGRRRRRRGRSARQARQAARRARAGDRRARRRARPPGRA